MSRAIRKILCLALLSAAPLTYAQEAEPPPPPATERTKAPEPEKSPAPEPASASPEKAAEPAAEPQPAPPTEAQLSVDSPTPVAEPAPKRKRRPAPDAGSPLAEPTPPPAPSPQRPASPPPAPPQEKAAAASNNSATPPNPELGSAARAFFDALLLSNPKGLSDAAAFPFYLEGKRVNSHDELQQEWAKALREKQPERWILYDIEVLSALEMEKRYGKPPERLSQWPWKQPGMFFAIASLSGHPAIALFRSSTDGWKALGYSD